MDNGRRPQVIYFFLMLLLCICVLCFDSATFENEHAGQEDAADKYAEDKLIPPGEYEAFVRMNEFSENAIRRFAERIDRDPGIVLGRLQNDQIVP